MTVDLSALSPWAFRALHFDLDIFYNGGRPSTVIGPRPPSLFPYPSNKARVSIDIHPVHVRARDSTRDQRIPYNRVTVTRFHGNFLKKRPARCPFPVSNRVAESESEQREICVGVKEADTKHGAGFYPVRGTVNLKAVHGMANRRSISQGGNQCDRFTCSRAENKFPQWILE